MKIGALAARTGMSVDTLRYYEKLGLLPRTARDAGGRRDFDASILDWIAFLGRLKATRMPLRDMQAYARLRDAGPPTMAARRDLLLAHRDRLCLEMAVMQTGLAVLDEKITLYAKMIATETGNDPSH
jgi:DNA-binding transcriptional MerR regulator